MQTQVTHKWFYSHAPEIVWEYLTDSELLAEWLMKNNFRPEAGYEFRFETKPLPNFNFDGIVYCKVLEIVPCSKLSYSWKGGPGDGTITLDSIVEWTLAAKDGGTELLLQHHGFKNEANAAIFAVMDEGWLKNMKEIEQLINSTRDGSNA